MNISPEILLGIIIALQSWSLKQIYKLNGDVARLNQRLDDKDKEQNEKTPNADPRAVLASVGLRARVQHK